jgi:hypothetical protein
VEREVSGAGSSPPASAVSSAGAFTTVDAIVVAILVVAGIFDWLSGNPIHSTLLFAAAVALSWDAFARRRSGELEVAAEPSPVARAVANRVPIPAALLGALAFSVVVGGFGRYSWPATVSVLVPCAFALVLAWRRPDETASGAEPFDLRGAVPWFSIVVAAGLFELTNLFLQPSMKTDSYAHPTFSVMTDPVLASHPGRSVVLILWLALGWFLMRR